MCIPVFLLNLTDLMVNNGLRFDSREPLYVRIYKLPLIIKYPTLNGTSNIVS